MANGRGRSVQLRLLSESKQAALNAVQTFNNPLAVFKTEAFIVLMVIAWRSLLHAYYRGLGTDYREFDQKPKQRRFRRTKSGAYRYWALERCLNEDQCPLDGPTKSNLRFLIGLRNEIEHHQSAGVDEALTGRYLACCLNYERVITELFGDRHSVSTQISYALQFRELTAPPPAEGTSAPLPSNVAKYISQFDSDLPAEEYQDPHFSYRLLFVRKLTSKPGRADRAIEFIGADADLAKKIDKEYWVQKEVERPKHLPGEIVKSMRQRGYPRFNMHHHTLLWKGRDAKSPARGYGVRVAGTWYWYDPWVDVVRKHCASNKKRYGPAPEKAAA